MNTVRIATVVPLLLGAVLQQCGTAEGEDLTVKLDEVLAGRLRTKTLQAEPAHGAKVLKTSVGTAIEPAQADAAVRIRCPASDWSFGEGTVGLRIRSSRRVGHVSADEEPRTTTLIKTPALSVELQEHRDSPRFVVISSDPKVKRRAICRIAYLEPDRWYHFGVSWRAKTGDVELYVNGWAQQRIHLPEWTVPDDASPLFELGGVLGTGDAAARLSVAKPELFASYMAETQLRRALQDREFFDPGSAVRQEYDKPLDLSPYSFELAYEPKLTDELKIIKEETLFEGDKRIRQPQPDQWVLEGPGEAAAKDGRLLIDNLESGPKHVVLWMPKVVDADFLLEFDITIERADEGLAIIFFAARPVSDPKGSIFQPGLPKREGLFRNYIYGDVNSYHVSYLAAGSRGSVIDGPRRTANVRKNSGFWLVACGDDQVQGKGAGRGPHHVRFLKVGSRIAVEANHRKSVSFVDDGKTWGPVLGDGYIGFRQMNHLLSAEYRNIKVFRVGRK